VAYALFAFTLGLTAGVVLRRSVSAIVAAITGFAAVRYAVEFWLRPHYRAPVAYAADLANGTRPPHTWWYVGGSGWVDAAGNPASLPTAPPGERLTITDTYLSEHGLRSLNYYQPDDRFWTFQFVETGIYLGLIAVLLVVVVWRNRRSAAN